jgi:IclR family transcriptional regulator, KDG regulon repressor
MSGGLNVTQIAELIGREKSQVSRTLKVLAEQGFVDRDPETLSYRLGWRVFALASRAGDQELLQRGARCLRAVVDDLGERVHLSVLDGAEVLTLLSESPPHAVQAAGWVGRSVPVYCTSSGRALLFDHEREAVASLLAGVELTQFGANTPRDVEDLYERTVSARKRGYAVVVEEFEPGLVGVAAPVRAFRGSIVAALNVSAPKFRFAKRLASAGEAVKKAAGELSFQLGAHAEAEPASRRAGETGRS